MTTGAAIANLAWWSSTLPSHRKFHQALQNPRETQSQLLARSIRRNAGAAFVQEHGFASATRYADFARRVPLHDYEDLEPWIERIRQGENRVLTEATVTRFIPTSGTGRFVKLIPFTDQLQNEFNRAISPWMCDLFRAHPDLAFGPAYWSITPAAGFHAEASAIPVGFDEDASYLGGARKWLVDKVMAVPSMARRASNIEDFRYFTLLALLRCRELRLISVWHPSFLTLLIQGLPRLWDELLNNIESGRCARSIPLPAKRRRWLNSKAGRNRAMELRTNGPEALEIIWPKLRLISCWADAHAALPARELQRLFPNAIVQAKGLISTEAFVSFPFCGAHPLAIRSHFFEFLDESGVARLAHELREGESYETVVTTSGGLWRYRMRDRVQVDGFVGGTASVRFLGRLGAASDLCGEKLSEAFVSAILKTLFQNEDRPPVFALLAPEEDNGDRRYILFVEGEPGDGIDARLDQLLSENPHYAWCRQLGQLAAPRIFRIAHGGYEAFAARAVSQGQRLGGIKPVALSTATDWARHFVPFRAEHPTRGSRRAQE